MSIMSKPKISRMRMYRKIHLVGQGAFYSEEILDNSGEKALDRKKVEDERH